jgi:RNA polymerase sigma factor (sigma-70 family)
MSDRGARTDVQASSLGLIAVSEDEPAGDDGSSHLISLHIALVKQQDREGMTLIWERYVAYLIRYVASQCKNKPRLGGMGAEDLSAETFESFWKAASSGKLADLRDRESLWRVLCTIAKRKVAHRVRDENRLKRGGGRVLLQSDAETGDGPYTGDFFDRFESPNPLPEDLAMAAEILESAHAALPDPLLRDVLDLWLEKEYSHPEIARTLGCSVTTVGRRVAEIRARLVALSERSNSNDD